MDPYLMQRIKNHERAVRAPAARILRMQQALALLSSDAISAPVPFYSKGRVMITVTSPRCVNADFAMMVNKDLCDEFGGKSGVRVLGALEYAVGIPCITMFGQPAYESLALNAAKMIESIVIGHVFTDGNKRTAWALALFFCASNGYLLDPSYPEAGRNAIVSLINRDMTVEDLAEFINANLFER